MSRSTTRSLLARGLGDWVRELNAHTLRADAGAAVLAAILALPQGLAFAALAGLPPAWGLYSAIVPTAVAALAGSSRHVLTGPTNTLALALAASLAPLAAVGSAEYLRLATMVMVMVGLLQLSVALLRLGTLTHFIAPSVLLGFTTGAALLIVRHALPDLGLWPTLQPAALLVAGCTLGLALGLRQLWPRGPTLLLALVGGTLAATGVEPLTGLTVGRIGALPQPWPAWHPPQPQAQDLRQLIGVAIALTVISLGQTVALGKTLAQRSGHALDVNRECLGQGLANSVGSFFSCMPSCGSLNRSLPHQIAGARTPLAAVMAAALLLALAATASPLLARVPMAAIAAVLLLAGLQLLDRRAWQTLLRLDRRDAAVAAGTGVAVLVLPLHVGVLAGVAASLVLYLHRTARPALRTLGFDRPPQADAPRPFVEVHDTAGTCPQLKLLRMEGPVWFGATAHVAEGLLALRQEAEVAPHLLVMSKSMNFLDPAGVALWEHERRARRALGGDLYFHRPRPAVLRIWAADGFVQRLGADHVFDDKPSAIAAIVPRLDGRVCASCTRRVFRECAGQPGGTSPRA